MRMRVIVLDNGKVIYNKVRVITRTFPFGNFMGCRFHLSFKGVRYPVRALPEPTYSKKHPLPYVALNMGDGELEKLSLVDIYGIREVRELLFPLDNAMRYITGRLKFGV